MLTRHRELRNLIAFAERHGWRVEKRRNSHLKWISPHGHFVFTSCTPSDIKAIHKIRRDLRRNGLEA